MRLARVLLGAGIFLPVVAGCTPTLKSAARDVTQAAVPSALDSGLEKMEEQRTRDRVLALMSSPEVRQSLESIATSFTKGVTEQLDSEELAKRSADLASSIASTAARVAMDAALSEIVSPANERRMTELMSVATAAATRSAIQAMADELPRSLGPAIGEMVKRDVAPNVRGMMIDPETRSTVAAIAFEASRQAVLGSNEAMAELEHTRTKQGLLAHLSGLFSAGGTLFVVLAFVAGASFVGLLIVLLQTRSKLRHARLAERVEDDVEAKEEKRVHGAAPPPRDRVVEAR
jgi:hypothetical protein